jgi:hypothetical protein
MLSVNIRSEENMESSSILTAFAAQLPSAMLLHLDSKLVTWQLVPRFHQLATNLHLDGKNRAMLRSLRPLTNPASKSIILLSALQSFSNVY